MIRTSIVVLVAAALAGTSPAAGSDGPTPYQAAIHLSGKIGSRPSTSKNEHRAHDYVARQFRAAGLDVQISSFRVPARGQSRNVIGRFDTPASCLKILMAHTDSVPPGHGAIDNASPGMVERIVELAVAAGLRFDPLQIDIGAYRAYV